MPVLRHRWISRPEAAKVSAALLERGYNVVAQDCNAYVYNVIRRAAGLHVARGREVHAIIDTVLDGVPSARRRKR